MIPVEKFRAVVGDGNCIREPEELRTYQSDGLASFRVTPGIVVLPSSTEEVAACRCWMRRATISPA